MSRIPLHNERALLDRNTMHILEGLPVGVFVQQNGKTLFINKSLRQIVGPATEGNLISPFLHEEHRQISGGGHEPSGFRQRATFRCVTRGGKEIHLTAQGVTIQSAEGAAVLYFTEDVAQRDQKEETLGAETRLLDLVSDGVICTDLELKITAWHRGAERIFGYSRSQVMGKHLSMLYEKGEEGSRQPQGSEFREKGEGFVFETPCLTRHGKKIWATFSISIIDDEKGCPTGFVATVQDITGSRQAHQALRESEKHYRTLVHAVPDYLYIVQIEGRHVRTLFHSPQCHRITGYTPEEYYQDDQLWFRMVHPEDRPRVLAFAQALNEGNEVAPVEHRIYHRDGSIRWVHNSASPKVINSSSKEVIIHGVVSELNRCNYHDQTTMESGPLSAMLENIRAECRDLEVPTQTILGRTELLLQALSPEDPHYRLISVIVEQAMHIAEINRKVFHILGDRSMAAANQQRIAEIKTHDNGHPDSAS